MLCVCVFCDGSEVKLQDSVPVSTLSTPAKVDIFNHPDSDDPVAQTLFKMIEPEDKVRNPRADMLKGNMSLPSFSVHQPCDMGRAATYVRCHGVDVSDYIVSTFAW